jgi:hypothetical protein
MVVGDRHILVGFESGCIAMVVSDRHILVGLGRFCLWVNCTAILVSINQPLRIYVNAIGLQTDIERQITTPESVGAGLC